MGESSKREKSINIQVIKVLVCFLIFYGVLVLISLSVQGLSIRSWVNWLGIFSIVFLGILIMFRLISYFCKREGFIKSVLVGVATIVSILAILAALAIGAMDIPEEHTVMHNGHKMIRVYAGFLRSNDEDHAIYYEPVGIFFKKYTGEKGEKVYPFWE